MANNNQTLLLMFAKPETILLSVNKSCKKNYYEIASRLNSYCLRKIYIE